MQTTPLDGAFGAEVRGVTLADAADEAFAKELRDLLLRERLLVFRGQDLDARSLRDVGRCLGTLDVHPFIESVEDVPEVVAIVKEADERRNFGGAWHSEVSFYEAPAMGGRDAG